MKFPGICFILRADKVKSYEEKTQEEGNMKERKVRFRHIEEMKEFVSAACRCDFDIDIVSDRLVVDGKSILGVFSPDFPGSRIFPARPGIVFVF